MTELISRLYGVVVPIDSKNFEKTPRNTLCYKDSLNNIHQHKFVSLQGMEILGTASEKEITFDCEPFVTSIKVCYPSSEGVTRKVFFDYQKKRHDFLKMENSFLSLIKSKGIELKPNEKLLVLWNKTN